MVQPSAGYDPHWRRRMVNLSHVIGALAEFERALIGERTRVGPARLLPIILPIPHIPKGYGLIPHESAATGVNADPSIP